MKMKKYEFDKETTHILKGLMIICMFIHHFFTFPKWYVSGISYPNFRPYAKYFCEPTKICVCIFAFLTGYFFINHKNNDFKYSLKKITDLLISYWIVFFLFLGIAIYCGVYSFTLKNFLLELFALYRPIMIFCWYVPFYALSLIYLSLVKKYITDSRINAILFGFVIPLILGIIGMQEIKLSYINSLIKNWQLFFCCVSSGFICSYYNLFSKIRKLKHNYFRIFALIFVLGCSFMGRYFFPSFTLGSIMWHGKNFTLKFSMDIFYAPFVVYSLIEVIKIIPKNFFFRFLKLLGKHSLTMWFLHCIFFNKCKEIFQPYLYFFKNPILVLIWGVLITLGLSIILEIPKKKILSLKDRVLIKLHII